MSETYIFGNVGQSNAQIGTNTMLYTTGSGNSAFGNNVFTNLTTGDNNCGFGVEVASGPSFNGSNNTVFGVEVIKDATTASDTSAFGYQASTATTTGNNNTSFGLSADSTTTSGTNNTIFGSNANTIGSTTSNALVVGAEATGADTSIVAGANAKCLSTGTNTNNIVMGFDAKMGEGSSGSMIIGMNAGNYGTMVDSIGIGSYLMSDNVTAVCERNTIFGFYAAAEIEDLTDSVLISYSAGTSASGSRHVAVGYQALTGDTFVYGYDNVCLGYDAGNFLNGSDNVLTGYFCGAQLRDDIGNTAIGGDAMQQVGGTTSNSGMALYTLVKDALTGTGGFSSTFTFYQFTVANPGVTNGVAGGTAATGAAGFFPAVFEGVPGAVGVRSEFYFDYTGTNTASIDGTYFLISSTTTDYYVWFNIDTITPDPGPPGLNLPALVGKTGIEVNLTSGASSFTIGNATREAIRNVGGADLIFIYTSPTGGSGARFPIINTAVGDVTDIADGTAVGMGKIKTLLKVRDGTVSLPEYNFIDMQNTSANTIAGSYFLISSATTDYYVWFNDGMQTDPAIGGRTGLEISYFLANYNTAAGYEALSGNTSGSNEEFLLENTVLGHASMREMNTGSHYNTIIGAISTQANSVITNCLAVGANTSIASGTEATVIGAGSSASSTATVIGNSSSGAAGVLSLGNNIPVVANQWRIGANSVSGSATLNFRTQTVADESWIGGGNSAVSIDNNGNIVRGTDALLEFSTTDITPTTMETYTMADNTTRQVEALVMGTRTGGTVGNSADTYSVRLDAAIKRSGGVTINKVTEIHVQDQPKSFLVTNLNTGDTRDLAFGTALGANRLQSYGTLTQGSGVTSEVSIVDFQNISTFTFAFTTYYLTFSSPTTDYYVWWNNTVILSNVDPALPGRTGIQVNFAFEAGLAFATLTQAAISAAALDITTVITSSLLRLTSVLGGGAQDIGKGTAALGNAGELTGVATAVQGIGLTKEVSIIDFTGATGAGLAGKYFTCNSPSTNLYVWYNTGASSDPGGAGTPLAGRTGVMISVLAGDTGSTLTTKTYTTLNGTPGFTAQITPFIPTTAMRMENMATGSVADIAPSSTNMLSPPSFNGLNYVTVIRQGSAAVAEVSVLDASGATPAGLAGTYFFLSSPTTNYYVWYRVDGITPDPGLIGTSLVVDIVTLPTVDTDTDIATKTAAAIAAVGGATVFTSAVQAPWVIDIVASGTDAILQVTGSEGVNITWKAYTRNFAV